jgi:hypothetical protein
VVPCAAVSLLMNGLVSIFAAIYVARSHRVNACVRPPYGAEGVVPRIVAEFAEPVALQLEAVEDHRFPVELSVRVSAAGATHPLALRYAEAEAALRGSVAYQERLASSLAELHDALERASAAEPSVSVRRGRPAVWFFVATLIGLVATSLAPNLWPEYGAFLPIWIGMMVLALGMEWLRRREQSVEAIPAGDPGAVVESARAVLVLIDRPLEGNVLTPAVRLDGSAGTAIRYLVPAAADRGIPKNIPMDSLVRHAREELERPRRLREDQERTRAERRQREAGVKNANLTLDSLRELNEDGRPAAE